MRIASGAEAAAQLARLPQAALVGLVVAAMDEDATLLALGDDSEAVAVDLRDAAAISPWLGRRAVLASWFAKADHRLLAAARVATPARWACARLCAQLLAEGSAPGEEAPTAAAAAAAQGQPAPPPPTSLQAMAASLAILVRTLRAQGAALRSQGQERACRLEAAAAAPVAAMEAAGMPVAAGLLAAAAGDIAAAEQQAFAALVAVAPAARGARRDPALVGRRLPPQPDPRAAAALGRWRQAWALAHRFAQPSRDGRGELAGDRGRVHADFAQIGTSTGRMACRRPNLQGIPDSHGLRDAFRPTPGRVLVVADYEACELRVLAQLSGEPLFLAAFARGADLHAEVASALFGRPVSRQIAPELREQAKTVLFGIVYGMGATGLAARLGWARPRAEALLAAFGRRYQALTACLAELEARGRDERVAVSLAGRRLRLPPSCADRSQAALARLARNMPIQGTGADLLKLALAGLAGRLLALPGAAIVLCVHDEIVVECALEQAAAAREALVGSMRAAAEELMPAVPAAVQVEVRRGWGAAA